MAGIAIHMAGVIVETRSRRGSAARTGGAGMHADLVARGRTASALAVRRISFPEADVGGPQPDEHYPSMRSYQIDRLSHVPALQTARNDSCR